MAKLLAYKEKGRLEAGLDEAGRGCLAGPVVAAAVILKDGFDNDLLNDSKQLSANQRNGLRSIIEKQALAFAVAMVGPEEIDRINILKASVKAMNKAVGQLKTKPGFLLVDGNRFYPEHDIPFQCFVKGDARFMSIAAASVLAKTYRDEYMEKLHPSFPEYDWLHNKGYPTAKHREAILKIGAGPHHRKSFRLLHNEKQLKIKF